MAFTSSVCPVNFRIGFSIPTWQMFIVLSVEHEANISSSFQSTSKLGAEMKKKLLEIYEITCNYKNLLKKFLHKIFFEKIFLSQQDATQWFRRVIEFYFKMILARNSTQTIKNLNFLLTYLCGR